VAKKIVLASLSFFWSLGCTSNNLSYESPSKDDSGTPLDGASLDQASPRGDLSMPGDMTPPNEFCGGHHQVCCPGNVCQSGCCAANGTCVDKDENCGNGNGRCGDNGCANCGGSGNRCCAALDNVSPAVCTASDTVCTAQTSCASCGGDKEPCCEGNLCSSGGCCVGGTCHASGTSCGTSMCDNGSCGGGSCGAVGQLCCGGGRCTASGARCVNAVCVACGGLDQRCCLATASQTPSFCGPPLKPNLEGRNSTCFCRQ
jgi:hypothetical protein